MEASGDWGVPSREPTRRDGGAAGHARVQWRLLPRLLTNAAASTDTAPASSLPRAKRLQAGHRPKRLGSQLLIAASCSSRCATDRVALTGHPWLRRACAAPPDPA